MQRCLYPLFQNQSPHFLLSSLFWKLSQPLGQDQQNSKQTYCQLPIIIFLWTPKGFISPESFLNFLLNLYIPPWLQKSFKFIVLRLLQIHLWVKKLNLFNFTHAAKQNSAPGFDHYPPGRRELSIPPEQHFLKIFFLSIKTGRELFSWQNYQNWQGYWSQVLINSTISATFTFLVYVLLCNNLAANLVKCEGSLT